jgi:phytoene desaturase
MSGNKSAIVIGAGFAGLSAAAVLAKHGLDVTVIEKNAQTGGRAGTWKESGFTFDMGPSWYWMPEVFENFYSLFGKKTSDFYKLKRLDPGYRIYYGKNDHINIPAEMHEIEALFESLENGSSHRLRYFLSQAKYKYETGMSDFVWRPSHSVTEFFDLRLITKAFRIKLFQPISSHIRKLFKNKKLIQLLEFPVLFLGATPQNTPALYSLMNYADLALGTWYPMGGMHEIAKAMTKICEEQGVVFKLNEEVTALKSEVGNQRSETGSRKYVDRFTVTGHRKKITEIITNKNKYYADVVISAADYEHTDQKLIDKKYRHYNEDYWNSRAMSPSSLLFYIGVNKKLNTIEHHNLFFDQDFDIHAREIYTNPQWPSQPLFYVCCPSKTDPDCAPQGYENLFFLMPLAAGLNDTEELRTQYEKILIDRFENITGEKIRDHIVVKRSFAVNDFKKEYNSFKGNAYGLANTLMQTAFFKPKMRSKKLRNLFYAGQLTVPGPGVPPSIISGQLAAHEALRMCKYANA